MNRSYRRRKWVYLRLIFIVLLAAAFSVILMLAPSRPSLVLQAAFMGLGVGILTLMLPDVLPSLRRLLVVLQQGTYDDVLQRREAERRRAELDGLEGQIADRTREAERLQKIIENYRVEASSEFRQAATDLLGEESATTVAGHFGDWAERLNRKHLLARRIAISLVVVGGAIVSGLLLYGVNEGFDTQLVIAKISVGIPFGVLYTVFYKESTQYRRDSLMAHNVAVQMRSVAAYTIWLDQESKNAVRRKLGEAIFVGPPSHLVHDGRSPEPNPLPQDFLLQVVQSLLAARPNQAAQSSGSTPP